MSIHDNGPPHFQSFFSEESAGTGGRTKSANLALEIHRRPLPVELCFPLVDLRGVRHSACGLRHRPGPPAVQLLENVEERYATERGQLVVKRAGVVVRGDGELPLLVDRAGVEAFVHLHDGDPAQRVAGQERPLDRCGAAPARQERCMDVYGSQARHRENRRRHEQSIGDDDEQLGPYFAQAALDVRGLQRGRLVDLAAPLERQLLDRTRRQVQPAPGRPIGSRQYENDFVRTFQQADENPPCELGCPRES
jgi:hypothetical protein